MNSPEGIEPNDRVVLTTACCAALASLLPVALYQTGVAPRLPDPPFDLFESERITSSAAAHPMGIPDALLGIGSFAATLTLILLSKRDARARTILGFKLTLDAAAAAGNATRQVVGFGKLCSWCSATAVAAGLMAYAGRGLIRKSWSESLSREKRIGSSATPRAGLEEG